MWESFCCCGAVSCCPLTSVSVSISQASFRFTNTDQNGVVSNWQYRTQASTVNTNLATLTINPTIVTAHICARHNVSGLNIPTCAYRKFNTSPTGSFGWISGVPWTGGSLVIDVDPTNPFVPKWFATEHRWVVYAETYRFGTTGVSGWEAGLRLEVRNPSFASPPTHPLGVYPPVFLGARSAIVANGCPTNLTFSQAQTANSAHKYRGQVRAAATNTYLGGTQRAGEVPTTFEQYIQYGIDPGCAFSVTCS